MPLPLKETPNEKRCTCGHRYSVLYFIKGGIHIPQDSIQALVCPDCGEPKVFAIGSKLSTEEAEARIREMVVKVVACEESGEEPLGDDGGDAIKPGHCIRCDERIEEHNRSGDSDILCDYCAHMSMKDD